MARALTLSDRVDQRLFEAIYRRSLVYNTCWEDPAVDRAALELNSRDRVLAITSAGCNVLDYALAGPARIDAVDANPRQTALLELKLAGIRRLEFPDFFEIFGQGHHRRFRELYGDALRADLSPFAREFWDAHGHWFTSGDSFYYRGLSGTVARVFRAYLRLRPRLGRALEALTASRSLEEQREVYRSRVAPLLWNRAVGWVLSRQITLSLLGVPHPQKKEVERQHERGVAGFVRQSVDYIATQLPVWNNYFWTVYLFGRYSRINCPEYLRRRNFRALKTGLAARIVPHTSTVTQFLNSGEGAISKFVLLDHMDWMSTYAPAALAEEWRAILARATPDARIIFRSAHAEPEYLRPLADRLVFRRGLAERLGREDRVHTYAGFHICDLAPGTA